MKVGYAKVVDVLSRKKWFSEKIKTAGECILVSHLIGSNLSICEICRKRHYRKRCDAKTGIFYIIIYII